MCCQFSGKLCSAHWNCLDWFNVNRYSISLIHSNAESAYYKVLMASAATSALRLQQRMPRLAFSREYFALLLVEDSCHYLFFSLIFLYVSPFILILLPVILFAILHAASYSLTLLDVSTHFYLVCWIQRLMLTIIYSQTLGQNSWWGARLLISIVELQTSNILRLVAFSEIALMPIAIIFVFL